MKVGCGIFILVAMSFVAPATLADTRTAIQTLHVPAPGLSSAPLRVRVLLPAGYRRDARPGYPVLYVNDGQDLEAVDVQATVSALQRRGEIRPMLVVAIDMPPDRMAGYGLSDRAAGRSVIAPTKYGPVGTQAHAYSEWLVKTLVPAIDSRYNTRGDAASRSLLGWSLGALNAFSVGWQYPETFGRVGAFSPSFWLSTRNEDAQAVQASRIAHHLVEDSEWKPRPRFFLAVGDAEETDDRDGDGLIDVIDDSRDLLQGVDGKGGLRATGYSINLDFAAQPDRAFAVLYRLPGGQHNQQSWARMLPAFLRWANGVRAPALDATGRIEGWQDFASRHVTARDVDVWLPPGYHAHRDRRYPVIYMHDGQNLFDPALVFNHTDWDIDGAMTSGIASGALPPAIIVGIANTSRRFEEYMPAVVDGPRVTSGVPGRESFASADIRSDAYLRFIVDELKPFIDAQYRTRPGRADTSIMGSSMGGLISLYAMARHPDVFGNAAAVSTHWPAGEGAMVDWFAHHLPSADTHRIWMDHGTETLDARYAPYQQKMDVQMQKGGFVEGAGWVSRVYPGTEHSEKAWRDRAGEILAFLLSRKVNAAGVDPPRP